MDALFILLTVGSLITSSETADQIIIRRGYLPSSFTTHDFFNYTDSSCGDQGNVHKWCRDKHAYQVTSLVHDITSSMCACYCEDGFKTFFSREKECVNISYLESLKDFENGVSKFDLQADFRIASMVVLYTETNLCNKCEIANIMYFEYGKWIEFSFQSKAISISNHCELSWKQLGSRKLAGKILKIQLKNCKTLSKQLFLLKSKGDYVIDLPTPPPPTVATTTPSFMNSTDTPTFTSSSTSTVALTTALTTSTHQASEFASTSQVSSTKTFRVSSYVCSSGDIYPSSSSAAVLLPTTVTNIVTMQSPTKLGRESSSPSSPWPIIAAVVGCIVVGGIIAGLVCLRRRKRENARARFSDNSAKVPPPDTDNPMYGDNRGDVISLPNRQSQIQKDGDEEYDYATLDGGRSGHQKQATPIYQSLIKDNVRDSVYAPLNKEGTETPVEYSYNHLQHPQYNPPRSKSDPLYNTLEQPNNDEYMEPETQIKDNPIGASEPVYNVLEGPDGNPSPQDDPVYNVLEDPDANQYPQDNDPVYNVLEDPDDNYDNAPIDDDQDLPASGQDNIAYSSTIDLKIPQTPSSPDYDVLEDPNGALPDSTYQPLSIRVPDDVYQPLDRTSQPIYQTLEPNDSTA